METIFRLDDLHSATCAALVETFPLLSKSWSSASSRSKKSAATDPPAKTALINPFSYLTSSFSASALFSALCPLATCALTVLTNQSANKTDHKDRSEEHTSELQSHL